MSDLKDFPLGDGEQPEEELLPLEAYTEEIIEELRLIGVPKPANVPLSMWFGETEQLDYKHNYLIQLAAVGSTASQIAKEMGLKVKKVNDLLANPKIKNAIAKKQDEMFSKKARKRLESLANKAVDVVEEVITNQQEQTKHRLDAAKYLLDQAVGKPQQQIEVKGNLLQEVLVRLEQHDRSIDVTSRKVLDKPKDAMDDFIDSQLEAPIVVGKRQREQSEEHSDTTIGPADGWEVSEDGDDDQDIRL